MAGKHRGVSRKHKRTGLTRYTLAPEIGRTLKTMARQEQRSMANMVSVLITEAIVARNHRAKRRTVG